MGYFLNIYECDHTKVSDLINSGIESAGYKTISKNLHDSQRTMLTKLCMRDYSRDPQTWESPDANGLIIALEQVCYFASGRKSVIEFYLDEDRAPELWTFSFSDWDVTDDFGLPVSQYGTPAVIYRDNKSLVEYLSRFNEMLTNGNYDQECLSEEDLKELIEVITSSVENNNGLFIFCWQ